MNDQIFYNSKFIDKNMFSAVIRRKNDGLAQVITNWDEYQDLLATDDWIDVGLTCIAAERFKERKRKAKGCPKPLKNLSMIAID